MTITDRIYGSIRVQDPLIIDLINSAPLQRLKLISQDGATHFVQPIFNGNRFEHSFGTWYLASRFNRPIDEQVACLLHDVPHTAFSHVVDFVMNDHNQEYHDRFLEEVVLASEIPDICHKHGLDIEKILDKNSFPLLNHRTPELSFDRWDYIMRDAFIIGILPLRAVEQIISGAHIQNGQFYFDDLAVASHLCLTSLMIGQLGYVSATSHGAWFLLARAIKIALHENIITEKDLFTTDEIVWSKLTDSHHPSIEAYISRLQPGNEFEYAPKSEAEFYGPNKARYINPLVRHNGKLVHTSELVVGLAPYIENFRQHCRFIGVKPAG
jgi:uncharacterized protein